jgi:hypothetical protein
MTWKSRRLKMARTKTLQPRSISSTESQVIQPYYRAGMHTELQKFGRADQVRQLMLGEDLETEAGVEVYGLDLSNSEDKALSAIQILLDKTNYAGNLPGDSVQMTGWKYDGFLPKLSMTFSEYYEAYGLTKRGDQYQGKQATEALQALRSLAQARRICYRRQRREVSGKRSKLVYDVIRVTKPLISFAEGLYGLDKEEADKAVSGQDLPLTRKTKLVIEISPLLVDQIDSFYLLKPYALYKEIQALLPGKRPSRATPLFIEWLLTLDLGQINIQKRTLAKKLRLDYLIEQRKPSLLDSKIQEALQTAKQLGYLLDYSEAASGLLTLVLNPDRCKRIKHKTDQEET